MRSPVDVQLSLPSSPEAVGEIRRAIEKLAGECGVPEERIQDIKTAVSEAATNAVVHGYADSPGEIVAIARCQPGEIEVMIGDRGNGMLPRRESDGLGLGLPLMSTLTDRLEISAAPDGRGTEVHMVFSFEARAVAGGAAA